MSLSLTNAAKLKWLWEDEHRCEWISTFLQISDKKGIRVPFVPTPEQRDFLNNMENRNIVLKSRQLGLSSIVIAESIREVVTRSNCTCLLVSHTQSSANSVFAKLKDQFFSLPEWLRPETISNNRQAILLSNGSSITCLTAGNTDLGRGATLNGVVHLSEFAFWKNPEKQLQALLQACTSTATVVIESTANGFNAFSDIYNKAKNGENDWKHFFFGWVNGSALFQDQYQIAVEKYKATHKGQILGPEKYDEDEKLLAESGATPEQIVWRRSKIADGGIDAFHTEFPATDTECFITTGNTIFRSSKISRLLNKKFPSPIPIDKLSVRNELRNWIMNGSLKVFKIPKTDMRYYAGVDCSEGIGGDYSTVFIMDRNGENLCTFHNNRVKPYEFSEVINALGRWYNNALLVIETASGGHSVIERLKYEYQYRNLYKMKSYDDFNRTVWKEGFVTNQKTKSIALNDAVEWFDKGLVHINDKAVLEEMKVFVVRNNGSTGAVIGQHDDLVSALWLCIQGAKSPYWYL